MLDFQRSTQALLDKLQLPAFKPLPLLRKGTPQTIAGIYFPHNPFLSDKIQHIITLGDQDKIVVIENKPLSWNSTGRIVLMIHGLTGSHRSKYLVRLTRKFQRQGYLVIRMNLRGCGVGKRLAKKLYHSGRSEDARAVIQWITERYPHSPITLIGFSIGGNITLKLAGEDGVRPSGNLDSVVAVSPPLDLKGCVEQLILPRNTIYDKHFVKDLIKHVEAKHRYFPELPRPDLSYKMNLYEFDDHYTGPYSGFKNADDYYQQNSSAQFIDNINLPTLILHAQDDPFIINTPFTKLPVKQNMDYCITRHGGHVGWLGKTDHWGDFRWMDMVILRWVQKLITRTPGVQTTS
jgi:hypothetical protein